MIRFPQEISCLINYEIVRSVMYRQMILNRGPVPENLLTFGERLVNLNLESTEGIFKGTVLGIDGSVALLFATDQMINAFQNATGFAMDGTFEVGFLNKIIYV